MHDSVHFIYDEDFIWFIITRMLLLLLLFEYIKIDEQHSDLQHYDLQRTSTVQLSNHLKNLVIVDYAAKDVYPYVNRFSGDCIV